MSEIVTAGWTAFFGVLVYMIGQITLKFWIEPVHELYRIIGEIIQAVTFYRNYGSTKDKKDLDAASDELRALAAKLRAQIRLIPMYRLLAFFTVIPTRKAILDASASVIGISNGIYRGQHSSHVDTVIELLDIPVPGDNKVEFRLTHLVIIALFVTCLVLSYLLYQT